MRKEQKDRPVTMRCGNGHRFQWELPHQLLFIEESDEPTNVTLMNYAPVPCQVQGCGATAVVDE